MSYNPERRAFIKNLLVLPVIPLISSCSRRSGVTHGDNAQKPYTPSNPLCDAEKYSPTWIRSQSPVTCTQEDLDRAIQLADAEEKRVVKVQVDSSEVGTP